MTATRLCRFRRRIAAGVVVGFALCAVPARPASAQAAVREADIKAGFLYNFARFVDWPAEAFPSETAPFRIEVIGRDPFDGRLNQVVAGKTIKKHPITVDYSLSATAIPSGHIVVISASEARRLRPLLDAASRRPILTVSDAAGFAEAGGIVGFVSDGNNIRFAINVGTAVEAHLRIDARMLALSVAVVKDSTVSRSK